HRRGGATELQYHGRLRYLQTRVDGALGKGRQGRGDHPAIAPTFRACARTPMNMFRFTLTVLALGLVTSGLAPDATAQAWPTKPVKVIAVFPAGGSVDQVARVLAQQLAAQTGQSFVVD